MHEEPGNLAQNIKRFRKRHSENQEEFGARFGVKRLAVGSWEKGVLPNSKHLPALTQLLQAEESAEGEGVAGQLLLPFDEPISFELKMSPQHAYTIHCEVVLKRKIA